MRKIGSKISLVIICFSCITTLIIGSTCLIQGGNLIKAETNRTLASLVTNYASEISTDIELIEYQVRQLKSHVESTFDVEKLKVDKNYVATYEKENAPYFYDFALQNTIGISAWCYFNPELSTSPHDIYYVDQNGDSIPDRQNYIPFSYYDNTPILTDDKYWWYGAVESKAPIWTNPYEWTLANGEIINVVSHASPIYINDQLIAVVGTYYHFNTMLDNLVEKEVFGSAYISLFNEKLDVIVHPTLKTGNRYTSDNLITSNDKTRVDIGTEMLQNESGVSGFTDEDGQKNLTAYARLSNGWILCINPPESDIYTGLYTFLINIIVAVIICIVISFFIALAFGYFITKPLLKVADGANKISTGDLSVKIDIKTKDEIKAVADSINNMVNKTVGLQKELSDLAYYDALTKIPNKTYFEKCARRLLAASPCRYAYIVIDINKFKVINETFGYFRGNELLCHVASNLNQAINEGEICARINADCFHVFLKVDDTAQLENRVKELIAHISSTYYDLHSDYKISIAVGIYFIDDRTAPIATMGDKASIAVSKVKGMHLSSIYTYNDTIRKQVLDEIEIEQTMDKALENGEFVMYLQPKFDIKSLKIVGAEALVRWVNPEKGIVPPDAFIPIFEKNGFIEQLDMFMLESACKLIKEWQRTMSPIVPISINQSRQYIHRPAHMEALIATLKRYNVPSSLIEIEITETAFFDNQIEMAEVVHELHNNGFIVSMDDFGSGCSSLNMLQNTMIDVLKIDKNFFNESIDTSRGKIIIGSVITMAKDLNIQVVAEGIETDVQLSFLRETACTTGQGYYFSKPIPVADFNKLIQDAGTNQQ